MIKTSFFVFFLCFGTQSSLGADCDFGLPQVSHVYEYAPPGTEVLIVDVDGSLSDISLSLDPPLSTYFELNGKSLQAKSSINITRDNHPITGKIECEPSTGLKWDVTVLVDNINNINPIQFERQVYIENLTESTALSSSIQVVATDPDVTNITYEIDQQDPPGYYKLTRPTQGNLELIKKLDYETDPTVTLTISATSYGLDNLGKRWQDTNTTTLVVNVLDEDDNPPQFLPCTTVGDLCVPPLYTSSVNKSENNTLQISPAPISANDLDTGVNADIEYSFINGPHDSYFEIDPTSGEVTMTKPVTDSQTQFTIPVVAKESSGRTSITYLIVDVIPIDYNKPTFAQTSYTGYIQESSIGSLSYVTEDENGTIPLRLNATDQDDPTAQFVYEVNSPYQVTSDGLVYYSPSSAGTFVTTSPATVTAINLNADVASENRRSDPVTVTVNIVMPATTPEATTLESTTLDLITTQEATTLEPTTLESTTPEPTTLEPTTLEPTTLEPTTLETITLEPTTLEPTTLEPTTLEPTTLEPTTLEPTTLEPTTQTSGLTLTQTTTAGTTLSELSSVSDSTNEAETTTKLPEDTTFSTTATPEACATCPELTTTEGVVILPPGTYVAASTLYGVAGGLGAALLICLLIIAFLIYIRCISSKNEETNKLEPSTTHHENAVYENEVTTNEEVFPKPDPTYSMTSDVEPKAVTFQDDDSGTEVNDYEKADSLNETEEEEAPDEPETVQTEHTPFEIEIKQGAAVMAASATLAAAATAVDNQPSVFPAPGIDDDALQDYGSAYKKKQVHIDKILTEGEFGQTRLVTIENYGLEKQNIQAIAKTLKIDLAPGTNVSSYHAQIRLMKKVCEQEHDNILQYCGMHENSSELHYAVAYAANGTLRNCLKPGLGNLKLDAFQMMSILSGIGKGLQFLHAKGIVHCNLQSRSIMLDEELVPKIRNYENNEVSSLKNDDDRQRWQAIEVLHGELSSAASDIWSYGVLMWYVAARGETPYSQLAENDIIDHLTNNYRLIKPSGCSQSLFSIMESCWNSDSRLRPDIYVIVANLDEKLTEDANDFISMDVKLAPNDVTITIEDQPTSSLYPVLPNPLENHEEDYTMF